MNLDSVDASPEDGANEPAPVDEAGSPAVPERDGDWSAITDDVGTCVCAVEIAVIVGEDLPADTALDPDVSAIVGVDSSRDAVLMEVDS